ncbi:MAG TPA: peptidylprolyl isomerase [Terriglobia bacterium]|nr:peptidylprolyl isomerase [Terriglobia bacterium]
MRTLFCCTLGLIVSASLLSVGQAAAPAKPPVRTPAASTASGPSAVIHTTAGDIHCQLFDKEAPIGVANFIGLANGTKDWTHPVTRVKKRGVPLYDGTIFHRVIPGFMIQGGDPAGNGMGDPGYKFKNETSPSLAFDRPGRLAYANAGPGTNGSQFFITEVPYPSLNGGYTIFGQCDPAAVELVKQIARMATDGEKPLRPVKITHIEIRQAGAPAPKPAAPKPAAGAKKSTPAKKPASSQ